MRILVAGAAGALGRLVVSGLEVRGHTVRAVVRRPGTLQLSPGREVIVVDALRPDAWRGACDGVDAVFSSIGASVSPSMRVGGPTYTRLDAPANVALLNEALSAKVGRFVYTSLIDGGSSRQLDYAEGHERVVEALRASGVPCSVLRPTGFFCAMTALMDLARNGLVPVFGDGSCRTNPVSEHDLAVRAVEEVESVAAGVTEVPIGGPETFTRRRIAEMAFEALGKRPRLLHIPVWAARAAAACVHPFNPRGAHFARFAAYIMTHDCLAPSVGTRRLEDAFAEHARHLAGRG